MSELAGNPPPPSYGSGGGARARWSLLVTLINVVTAITPQKIQQKHDGLDASIRRGIPTLLP